MKFVTHKTDNEPFERSRKRLKKMVARVDLGPGRQNGPRNINARPLAYSTDRSRAVVQPRHISTNKGHLIALKFGGPDIQDNMVPMYGRFNQSGLWAVFEREIENFVDRTVEGPVDIEITCHYSTKRTDDQRIPVRFTIKAKAVTGGKTRYWRLNHPAPSPVVKDRNDAEKTRILALRQRIIDEKWSVEEQIDLSLYPSRRSAPVLPEDLAKRPYAFLDYEKWDQVKNLPKALETWRNSIMGATTESFAGEMRGKILLCNRILNDGKLISDESSDPAFGNHQIFGENYRWPGGDRGLLVLGGHDLEPEVDHIIPKSLGGFAIFSNASVVSAKENSDKRARVTPQQSASIQEAAHGNKKREEASLSDGRGSTKRLRRRSDG